MKERKDKIAAWIMIVSSIISGVILAIFIPDGGSGEKIIGALVGGPTFGFICLLIYLTILDTKRRRKLGIPLSASLESDPEVVKANMLFVMQFGNGGGIVGQLKEFNETFRCYPEWELEKWEVFQAWYKHQFDHMCQYPEIYGLRFKDGSPYDKEKDPLYNPDAPDWEQFDKIDYSEEEDDPYANSRKSLGEDAADGLAMGVGLGAGLSALDGNSN